MKMAMTIVIISALICFGISAFLVNIALGFLVTGLCLWRVAWSINETIKEKKEP